MQLASQKGTQKSSTMGLVSDTHLFWGQKVKVKGHNVTKTVPACVFALL